MDDHGLLRINDRLMNLPLSDRANPLLLIDSPYAQLTIKHYHQASNHQGTQHLLANVRHRYWIMKGRRVISDAIKHCRVCRRHAGPSYEQPPWAPVPIERLERTRPFKHIGLDYLGPVDVGDKNNPTKCHIVLFTCFTTRAIHLEPVFMQTPHQFINAFRRFVNRRGVPSTMLSDQATYFTASHGLVTDAQQRLPLQYITVEEVFSYLALIGVVWKFTTPVAPWEGGMYERLVAVVKAAFKKAVRSQWLSHSEFWTLITECEAIVNARPITYVYQSVGGGNVIRPVDFLTPGAPTDLTVSKETAAPTYDTAGKLNNSENVTFGIDTIAPRISYFKGTLFTGIYNSIAIDISPNMIIVSNPNLGIII